MKPSPHFLPLKAPFLRPGGGQVFLLKSFVLLILTTALAPALSPVGLLPDDKVSVVVADGERNPFGRPVAKEDAAVVDNEEARIRSAIDHLAIGGVIESSTGKRVLLGSHALGEGVILRPVVARQKEKVQVVSIADDKVELAFLEANGEPGSRRIIVTPNLVPTVKFRVAPVAGPREGTLDGVLTRDEMGFPQ